jgi:hypothetical protein
VIGKAGTSPGQTFIDNLALMTIISGLSMLREAFFSFFAGRFRDFFEHVIQYGPEIYKHQALRNLYQ